MKKTRPPRVPRQGSAQVKIKVKRAPGPLVLATDASVAPHHVAVGFLCTNGRAGFRAHPYPENVTGTDRTTIAELRAVYWALKNVRLDGPAEIRTDSQAALSYLRDWQNGSTRMPASYSTAWRRSADSAGAPSLESLARRVAEEAEHLSFSHVRGHQGEPLNEGAHYMAFLGMRCLRQVLTRERAQVLAETTMDTSLVAYAGTGSS